MTVTCPHCERDIDVPEIIELNTNEREHLIIVLESYPDCEGCQALLKKL